MDENEQMTDNSPIAVEVKPQGVPEWVAVVLFAAMVIAVASAFYFRSNPATSEVCKASDVALKAQADSARVQNELNVSIQRRVMEVQMAVMKSCMERGNIPTWMGGNVDCKPSK